MKPYNQLFFVFLALLFTACTQTEPSETQIMTNQKTKEQNWKAEVEAALKQYGHRNWIVIADAAYPKQSNPAIETIVIGGSQLDAVRYVSELIEKAAHVDGIIYLDRELAYVSEKNAKGVSTYRTDLNMILEGKSVTSLLHEDIIRQLDESAKLFNVLILKTNLTIPYTSVFFQLECGYWPSGSEQQMRDEMNNNMEQN